MRVTLVCVEWPGEEHVGGAPRYGFRLAETLSSLVDLTVITSSGGMPLPNAKMVYLDRATGRLSRYYLLPFRVRKTLRTLCPDIVHSFGDDWAIGKCRSGKVRTFLGSSWSEALSSKGLRRLNHFVLACFEKVSQRKADVRIAIGPESFEAFDCQHLMPPVVPLCAERARKALTPRVIFIGSYASRKRGHLVQKAVETASRCLEQEIELVVVGPAADKKNWPAATTHVSDATDMEVHRLIQESWVLMAPSAYEGFGIPAFEALSLGVPALCSPNPGSEYLGSIFGTDGVFTIAPDSELASHLSRRIAKGPVLDPNETETARRGVSALLALASAQHLVDDIYTPLVRRKRTR